jgi:hypothetical protein
MNGKKTLTYEHEETGRCFEIEVELNFYKENYGADADGNRGEMRSYCDIEGYEITEEVRTTPEIIYQVLKFLGFKLKAWKTITIDEEDLPAAISCKINSLIDNYDYFDDDDCCGESEPDYDAINDEREQNKYDFFNE